MSEATHLRRLRSAYARQGLVVHKVPERSRWYVQYGPFMLSDARTHAITAAGMTFEQLAEQV